MWEVIFMVLVLYKHLVIFEGRKPIMHVSWIRGEAGSWGGNCPWQHGRPGHWGEAGLVTSHC